MEDKLISQIPVRHYTQSFDWINGYMKAYDKAVGRSRYYGMVRMLGGWKLLKRPFPNATKAIEYRKDIESRYELLQAAAEKAKATKKKRRGRPPKRKVEEQTDGTATSSKKKD